MRPRASAWLDTPRMARRWRVIATWGRDSTVPALGTANRAGRETLLRGTMQVSATTLREVAVSARAVLVVCVLCVSLSVAADPPKPASAEEIATAIRQLGDSRYATREQATKRLWLA